jgi:hypothetical protein
MKSTNANSTLSLTGRIDRKTYTDSTINDIDSWDSLTKSEKLDTVRELSPDDSETVYNVTTDRLHQYFVDNLDPENTSTESNLSVEYLALGTDAGSGTTTADTDLNNRVYSETITDAADNGKDLLASTFIDSTEGNGETFDELGLFTGDPQNLSQDGVFLMNHATFSPVQKDNTKTVVFDVTLTFSDV